MDASNTKSIKHTEPSKQNNQSETALDKFHETLIQSAGADNKMKINDFKSPSFYLPPLGNVCEFLGFPSTLKQLMDLLETAYEVPLKVKSTSRYNFINNIGVGTPTVSKIIDWCKELPLPFETLVTKRLMAKILKSRQVGSNAGNWFSALYNFDEGYQTSDAPSEHELQPLFDFIEHRCKTEVSLLSKIRSKLRAGELKSTDSVARWNAQETLWDNSAGIPQSAIDGFVQTLTLKEQQKPLTEQQTLTFIESYCHLVLDFYFEAITHYEIGCRLYFGNEKQKINKELGMISKAINAYATDDEVKTCFGGVLTELKNFATEFVGKTTYRTMASFIDIEEEEQSKASGNTLEAKQHNQLKDWRNGRMPPSTEKLATFLVNLDEYLDKNTGFVTFFMCRIALGVDKLVSEIIAHCEDENCQQADVEVIIKKVLATMPDYYHANLKRLSNKIEPTT